LILQETPVNDHIEAISDILKNVKDIQPPEWAVYAKTGMHKERPPVRADWWYVRAAAVLRSVDRLGPVGVSKLRTKYGGKKNRGHKPGKFFRGSGNILRKVLQQLEKAGLVKKEEKDIHRGRILTPAGRKMLNDSLKEAKKSYSKRKAEQVKPAPQPVEKKPQVETKPVASKPVQAGAVQAKPVPQPQKVEQKPQAEVKPEPKVEVKKEEPKPEIKKEEPKATPIEEKKEEKPAEKVPTAHELAEKKNE